MRQHGISKRRTWRKLHIGGNEANSEIMAAVVTTNAWRDDEVCGLLLDQIPQEVDLEQVSGDGIYDSKGCYELLEERGVRAVIPPRRGARLADLDKKPHLAQRNANIKRIRE